MTNEQMIFLTNVCHRYDIDYTIRDDYSGRGMFGKKTCAITVASPIQLLTKAVNYVASQRHPQTTEVIPSLNGFSVDSMGYDKILY